MRRDFVVLISILGKHSLRAVVAVDGGSHAEVAEHRVGLPGADELDSFAIDSSAECCMADGVDDPPENFFPSGAPAAVTFEQFLERDGFSAARLVEAWLGEDGVDGP